MAEFTFGSTQMVVNSVQLLWPTCVKFHKSTYATSHSSMNGERNVYPYKLYTRVTICWLERGKYRRRFITAKPKGGFMAGSNLEVLRGIYEIAIEKGITVPLMRAL